MKIAKSIIFIIYFILEFYAITSCFNKNSENKSELNLKNYYTKKEIDELLKKYSNDIGKKENELINYYTKDEIDKLLQSNNNFDYAIFEYQTEKGINVESLNKLKGQFIKRKLNMIVSLRGNSIILDIDSSIITLLPGKYKITASAPAYSTAHHQLILKNLTSNTTSLYGTVESSGITGVQTRSFIDGIITVKNKSKFQLEHFISFSETSVELGVASNSGEKEVFTRIFIQKIN
jgi:hypothetical protein